MEERLLRLLERRGCLTLGEAAAALRATPSEVAEAAERLGAYTAGGRLCPPPRSGGGQGRRRWRLLRRGGCCVVAVEARGGGLPGLVAAARYAARLAARLGPRLCREGCRVVAPALEAGSRRDAVEGVAVLGRLDPCSEGPHVRRYTCRA